MMKTPDKSESKIQQEIVVWYTNNYCLKIHEPREIIFHVPNEGQQRLISIGLLPGVSDLICTVAGRFVFFEVKRPGEKQRPKQIDFEKRIKKIGYDYFIVESLAQFQNIILHLLNNEQDNKE